MLATPLAMMLSSPIGGGMTDRHGTRPSAALGLTLIAAGCILMSCLGRGTSPLSVASALLLFGIGNGFSVSAINTAVLCSVPSQRAGVASGMVATMRNLGQTLGVAFGSSIIALRQGVYGRRGGLGKIDVYALAQRDSFFFGLVVTLLALLLVSMLPRREAADPEPELKP
jgi:MFS family permease